MADGTIVFRLALLGLVVVLSAFFSASEAAFLSVQRHKVRRMVDTGVAGARHLAGLVEHPHRFLPTVLVGNNLVNSAAAALATVIAVDLMGNEGAGALVAAFAVAVLLIVFAESLPKTLGSLRAERVAVLSAAPVVWIGRLLFPLVWPLQKLNGWVAARIGGSASRALTTQEDLKVLISLNREAGGMDQTEAAVLLRTLRLVDLEVREVMMPRTQIVGIEAGMSLREFLEFNARQYHSRFPVLEKDIENVVGVLEAKDVLRAMGSGALRPEDSVTALMRPAFFVSESRPLLEAIGEMRRKRASMAFAMDEFGSLAGAVTYNYLLSQIMGGIEEEGEPAGFKAVGESTFHVKGSMPVFEANEQLHLGLEEGEYDTVAGLVLEALGRIPAQGDRFIHNGLEFTVTEMRGLRIEEVRIVKRAAPEPAPVAA